MSGLEIATLTSISELGATNLEILPIFLGAIAGLLLALCFIQGVNNLAK